MLKRRDASFPFQEWKPFPDEAIVLAINAYGDRKISVCKDLWWGYELDMGSVSEGTIIKAKRLDRRKTDASDAIRRR